MSKYKASHVLPGIIAIALLMCSTTVLANAGKVMFSLGDVNIVKQSGSQAKAKRGAIIDSGDMIVTGKKGQAQIRMNDGGLIAVRPASRFVIDSFKYTGSKATDESLFKLVKGGFRSITGAVGEANKAAYQVKTPVATIGIRGTDYSARLCASDCGSTADGLYLGVMSGGVTLTNETSQLDVNPGEYGYVADEFTNGTLVDSTGDLLFAETSGSSDLQVAAADQGSTTDLLLPRAELPAYAISDKANGTILVTGLNSSTATSGKNGVTWGIWADGTSSAKDSAGNTITVADGTHFISGSLDQNVALPVTGSFQYQGYIGGGTTPTSSDAGYNAGNSLTSATLDVDFSAAKATAWVQLSVTSDAGDLLDIQATSNAMSLAGDGTFSGTVASSDTATLYENLTNQTSGTFAGGLAGSADASMGNAPAGAFFAYNLEQDLTGGTITQDPGADSSVNVSGTADLELFQQY